MFKYQMLGQYRPYQASWANATLQHSMQYIYKAYSMDRFVEMNAPERKQFDSIMLVHMSEIIEQVQQYKMTDNTGPNCQRHYEGVY